MTTMKILLHVGLVLSLFTWLGAASTPNVVVLLVDDLGYGDVGFLGNSTIRTPNLDKLASQSISFTQAYAAAPICTPSRGAIQTGRMASRLGLTSNDTRRVLVSPAQNSGLEPDEVTMAEVAKAGGYATGLIGKWHLGIGRQYQFMPTNQGYDVFWGLPLTNVMPCGGKHTVTGNPLGDPRFIVENLVADVKIFVRVTYPIFSPWLIGAILVAAFGARFGKWRFVPAALLFVVMWYAYSFIGQTFSLKSPSTCLLYNQNEIIEQPVRLQNFTERLTSKATDFIRDNAAAAKPFLAFVSFAKVHTALFTAPHRSGVSAHGAYGDNVEEMDWAVGEILAQLDASGVRNDTIVFFTSDHGPWLERFHEGGFAGRAADASGQLHRLKGGKAQVYEGGVRVPFLFSWPARFAGDRVSTTMVSLMDMFATVVDVVGHDSDTLLAGRPVDGRSLLPLIDLPDPTRPDDSLAYDHHPDGLLFYCGRTLHAARVGRWKLFFKTPKFDDDAGMHCKSAGMLCECNGRQVHHHDPPLLFDMAVDPGETTPLSPESDAYARGSALVRAGIEARVSTYLSDPDAQPERLLAWPLASVYYKVSCCDFPKCECCRECEAHASSWADMEL